MLLTGEEGGGGGGVVTFVDFEFGSNHAHLNYPNNVFRVAVGCSSGSVYILSVREFMRAPAATVLQVRAWPLILQLILCM